MNLQCYEPSGFLVSVTMSHQLSPSVAYLHLLSEFIGRLDDGSLQPLVVKYSHKADAPLQTLKNNLKRADEQTLRLARNGW